MLETAGAVPPFILYGVGRASVVIDAVVVVVMALALVKVKTIIVDLLVVMNTTVVSVVGKVISFAEIYEVRKLFIEWNFLNQVQTKTKKETLTDLKLFQRPRLCV